ncbi:AAAP amino acid permease [Phlebopus sp. FC_14]|nr:AAAP amino acid permease [Phlebopus sp. FC_14]
MPPTISFFGSIALLVSSLTGPSLAVIPLLFQQAGWLSPSLVCIVVALLSGLAALLLVEAMASIQGNEKFQAAIEFTTIAHLFFGKRWHLVVQGFLYVAMQTIVIASLIESFQSMDAFLLSVVHKTCAISFQHGWICTRDLLQNGAGAFSGEILGSFGTLIVLVLVLPLSLLQLVDNIKFQVASFIVLIVITLLWIVVFARTGVHHYYVPVVGQDQSSVVGFVLSNFAFVTTIPAWVNNVDPSVDIRLAVWLSLAISCIIYIPVGWLGASAYRYENNATILGVLSTDSHNIMGLVSTYMFPLAVLITSVPVFAIVIRYNLLRGNLCSKKYAVFWSAILPWLIAIPFQTNGWVTVILNWASLIFTFPSNLLVPFILYVISKRYRASAILDANVTDMTQVTLPQVTSIRDEEATFEAVPIQTEPLQSRAEGRDSPSLPASGNVSPRASIIFKARAIIRQVVSPSIHRDYGQSTRNMHTASEPSSSLSVPRCSPLAGGHASSPVHQRTIRSAAGTDEFRLTEAPLRVPGNAAAMRDDGETTVLAFQALPSLKPTSALRPTRLAWASFVVASALVLVAIVYDVVLAVRGDPS